MTAKVLVVDDEPDLEDLVRQRFRRQIKEGSIAFGFARDGVEALALLADARRFRHGRLRHQHAAHGRTDAARQAARRGDEVFDRHRLGLWRHGQYSHRHEPGRVRLPDQANRLRRLRGHAPQDDRPCRPPQGRASAPGGSRARACVAVALFFAQPRAQSRGRAERARARRRATRDRDFVHRHRRIYAAGRIARSQTARGACSAAISKA